MTLPLPELIAEMARKPSQYEASSPNAIASGSKTQMMYFIEDAKKDIALLFSGYREIQEENAGLRKDIGACHATFAKPINILNDRVEAREAEISALKSLLREALAALEPFGAFCEKAERFVEGRANFGGSPIRPVKDFRLSHFHAARSVAAHIKKGLPDDR